jgi:hypothetical protein
MKRVAGISIWVAHASRVLVAVSRRNKLSFCCIMKPALAFREVRDSEDAIASTRDACATQINGDVLPNYAS